MLDSGCGAGAATTVWVGLRAGARPMAGRHRARAAPGFAVACGPTVVADARTAGTTEGDYKGGIDPSQAIDARSTLR
jgi:hypothetical protein